MRCMWLLLALVVLLEPQFVFGDSIVINFDQLTDGDLLTTVIDGLTFSNAIVLTAGLSLNEFDFPPFSGSNVVADIGGPLLITFDDPITNFAAYFTYGVPLSLTAFGTDAAQVAQAASLFVSNLAALGGTPNELVQIAFAGGINSILVAGDPGGSSFTMDSLTYTPAQIQTPAPVPEPGTLTLMILGLTSLLALRYRKRIRNHL